MKKFMSLILVLALVLTCLVACGKKEEEKTDANTDNTTTEAPVTTDEPSGDDVEPTDEVVEPTGEVEKVVVLYPGEETDTMHNFVYNQLNPRLAAEAGIELEMIYKGWDQYWDQKEVMLAAGTEIDLYWDGLPDLAKFVNNSQAQPMDELLQQYGQDMLKVIPESQLAGGQVDGVQYGIPSAYAPSSAMFQLVCLRQDLMDGVGMTDIKTAEDLKEYATKVKDAYPEMNGPADIIFKPLTRYFQTEGLTWCAAGDAVVYGEDSKKAYDYFETDAFKSVAKFNESMYADGLYKDELTTNYNERDSRMQQGTYLWVEGSLGKENEISGTVQTNDPNAVLKSYLLNPDEDKYITACGGEVLCIPYSAQNPAGAIKFLNFMYKNQENYLFCLYGVEGEDYTIENDRIVLADGWETHFDEWMFRNANYTVFTADVTDEYIETYKTWDSTAKTSDVIAFHFNNENVKEIETAITEVINQKFTPIECGYVSFDDGYDAALADLKAAGIDEYVAEVQRQLDEFFAANGYNH